MRESMVFMIGVICFMVGGVLGVLIKHLMDEKHFADLNEELFSKFERIKKQNEIIRRLIEENNRLQIEGIKNFKPLHANPSSFPLNPMTAVRDNRFARMVFDEPLPDHFADDIDFGGKF